MIEIGPELKDLIFALATFALFAFIWWSMTR